MRGSIPLCALVVACALPAAGAPAPDVAWLTPAEIAAFEATPGYDETLAFVDRLASADPALRRETFGLSAEGRPLPSIVVAKDGLFDPAAATGSGRAIVLVQAGIHAGEIDGKDAMLMLLRDLVRGRHREILDGVVLLFVPFYNADGHERVSPANRPNQNGPARGTGFRTTADGHDLNRDHVKLETPEARALVQYFARWRPHLHVDTHVTNGSDHGWVLTYAWAEAPQLAGPLHAWMERTMPGVLDATRAAGHPVGPYVDLLDRTDPTRGFSSRVGEPRYSTGYFPLRNRPSILLEGHAYKPYETRVRATYEFLLALLRAVAREPRSLVEAVELAERETIARGRPDAAPSSVALRYAPSAIADTIELPLKTWRLETSIVTGAPLVRYADPERPIEVPWDHVPRVELAIDRPRGYLVLPGWPAIERRLLDHALEVRRLTAPVELDVTTLRLSEPRREDPERLTYQGLTRLSATVTGGEERVRLPAGTLWIPADQPDFELAAQLLEPEAPDSLFAWGLLSIVLEPKEYVESRILEDLARERLADPAAARDWKRALEDETLASDPRARYLWWYRKSGIRDETVGRMPVMRLMRAAALPTAPWDPAAIGPP